MVITRFCQASVGWRKDAGGNWNEFEVESHRCTDASRESRVLEEDSHFARFLNSEKIHRPNAIPCPINQIVSLGKEDRFHSRGLVETGYYWRVR